MGRTGSRSSALPRTRPGARALERAEEAGVETAVFPVSGHSDRLARDLAIADWLTEREVDLVVLAGYMQLLSGEFILRFPHRIVNVHPALLPSFPGLDAVQQALDHGSKITGVTVHFVDEGVDSGPIIFQRPVPVPPSRDWDELEAAIHATEHALLPETIRLIAAGRVSIDPANPRLVVIEPE